MKKLIIINQIQNNIFMGYYEKLKKSQISQEKINN